MFTFHFVEDEKYEQINRSIVFTINLQFGVFLNKFIMFYSIYYKTLQLTIYLNLLLLLLLRKWLAKDDTFECSYTFNIQINKKHKQHTAAHFYLKQHTAAHFYLKQHTTTQLKQHKTAHLKQHTAAHFYLKQHTAAHFYLNNTQQHN